MLEGYLQRITKKGHQHVGLHPLFQLMEQRPDGQLALERTKGSFHFRQLHILLPEICSTIHCQIRAQQIGSLSRFEPLLLLRFLPPDQTRPLFGIFHDHLVEIRHLWMRSLNATQAHKHFAAVLQLAFRDAFLQSRKCFFDLGYKAAADGFLLLLPSRRAAQDVSLFAAGNSDLFDLHFRTDLLEIILEQFLFELLQLAAGGAHQILSPTLADGHQVLLTHDPAVENPYSACFSMFTLHRAQNRFDGGNIGAVPIEQFVAERKTVLVDDQCQNQLRTVRWPVRYLEHTTGMLLQLGLTWQETIQTAIQPRVV